MDEVTGSPEYRSRSSRPARETVVLASSFLLVFSSFQALQNLQSTLNQEDGLGLASLATVYGLSFVSSIFTPAILYHTGVKRAVLAAWGGHVIYVACNFRPGWISLLLGSAVLGVITCPLWTASRIYLSALARLSVERDLAKKPTKVTTMHAAFSRLNGLFHSIFLASQLAGNVASSTILFQADFAKGDNSSSADPQVCGADYCPLAGRSQRLPTPDPIIVYVMLGVFLALDVAGLLVTWCCLPGLEQPSYVGRDVARKLRSYWLVCGKPKIWLIIPLFISNGITLSLHVGTFTEAFVGCSMGVRLVGYVMCVWGVASMLSSGLMGYLARFTGRPFLFAVAFAMDAGVLTAYLVWTPHSASLPALLVVAGVMGVEAGLWAVQRTALVAVLFPAVVDSAFSVTESASSLSAAASFAIAHALCPRDRVHVALALLALAALTYAAAEVVHRRGLRTFSRDEHGYVLAETNSPPPETLEDEMELDDLARPEEEVRRDDLEGPKVKDEVSATEVRDGLEDSAVRENLITRSEVAGGPGAKETQFNDELARRLAQTFGAGGDGDDGVISGGAGI